MIYLLIVRAFGVGGVLEYFMLLLLWQDYIWDYKRFIFIDLIAFHEPTMYIVQ